MICITDTVLILCRSILTCWDLTKTWPGSGRPLSTTTEEDKIQFRISKSDWKVILPKWCDAWWNYTSDWTDLWDLDTRMWPSLFNLWFSSHLTSVKLTSQPISTPCTPGQTPDVLPACLKVPLAFSSNTILESLFSYMTSYCCIRCTDCIVPPGITPFL